MGAAVTYPGSVANSSAKPSVWLRFFPSLTDFAFLLPIWFLFSVLYGTRTLLADGDTGWHIRTGDWILQHGQVPHQDIFSFTKAGQPWFAWEWGWDVLASLIHTRWGLPGIAYVNALLLGVISALLFRVVRRHTTSAVLALVVSGAAVLGSAFHWLARPHLLSWLFVLLFLDVIDRLEYRNQNRLWLLPPLTLLWVNLHGSFFIGISFLFAHAIVGAVQELLTSRQPPSLVQFVRPMNYLLCGSFCLLVSLINPYGWHLHQHLVAYLFDSQQLDGISEFSTLNFKSPLARFYELFFLFGPCAAVFCFRKRQWPLAILLLLWAHLSLSIIRNVPIYLMLAAPALANFLDDMLSRISRAPVSNWVRKTATQIKSFGTEFSMFEAVSRIPLLSAAGAVALAMLMGVPSHQSAIAVDFDRRDFPVDAASLIAGDTSARVFTHDQWGDYLIYRFYPNLRVFVDGRSDFYGNTFSEDWVRTLKAGYDWQRELLRYSIDTVLLRTKDPLASVLKQSSHWKPVFDDGTAIVFRPKE